MPSVNLSSCCSCYVFFAVKQLKCSAITHFAITQFENKSTRPQVFLVKGSIICNVAALLTSSVQYGKILPNLVNSNWL